MAVKMLNPLQHKPLRHHTVRFTSGDMPKYKNMESSDSSPPIMPSYRQASPSPEGHSGPGFQPAMSRLRINEQRIRLLTQINQILQQRADLETNRVTLSDQLDELKRKLKRRTEECIYEKKENMKALKLANQRLEKEKLGLSSEIDHVKRHLLKEEAHHVQHARTAVAQAIQGVTSTKVQVENMFTQCSVTELPNVVCRNVARNAPSKSADSKLLAARLMRDIAELRQRVAQAEIRLANEQKSRGKLDSEACGARGAAFCSRGGGISGSAALRAPPSRVKPLPRATAQPRVKPQPRVHPPPSVYPPPHIKRPQIQEQTQRLSRRKRQAEMDIVRLRKELSNNKSYIASLRLAPPRKQCSKFA